MSGQSLTPYLMHPTATRLMEDILKSGSSLRIKVTGKSMSPFIHCNDIVTAKKIPFFSLKPGDLILFKNNDGYPVLHRIIKKSSTIHNEKILLTKGDSMLIYDDPVGEKNVLGKIFSIEKQRQSGLPFKIDFEKFHWQIICLFITLFQWIRSALLWKKVQRKTTNL